MNGASVVSEKRRFHFSGRVIYIDHMSLKAKIEAVIYAAEEPVTLAQLAALLPCRSTGGTAHPVGRTGRGGGRRHICRNCSRNAGLGWEPPLPVFERGCCREAAERGFGALTMCKQAARLRDREVRDELRRVVNGLIAEYDDRRPRHGDS